LITGVLNHHAREDGKMKEMHAVVGYVPDKIAAALGSGKSGEGPVLIRLEAGSDDFHVKIDSKDIRAVLLGPSQKGETGVQVFLNDKVRIDTVAGGLAGDFLRPIRDLSFLKWRLPINVIYVDPRWLEQAVQAQRK
jgi:hypothetical protein